MAVQENAELRELVLRSSALAAADSWGDEALRVNERIVELASYSAQAWWRLGICLKERQDFSRSRAAFSRSAECAQTAADRRAAHRKVAQIDAYLAALDVSDFAEASRRAISARDAKHVDEALVWHWRALALAGNPRERARAHSSWASTLRGDRKSEEALEHARSARADAPDQESKAVATTVMAAALADLGRLGEAESTIDALLEDGPGNPYAVNAALRIFTDLHRKTGDSRYSRRINDLGGRR
jgi:tetratricopeptide (TPR) repeat protein